MEPVFIGVYYGKQESTSSEEIQDEYDKLTEELLEVKAAGEVILCMDANAKIGLMKEKVTRNGRLMLGLLDECEMEVMNKHDTCIGTITRQNRKKQEEKSAIDLVIASYEVSSWFSEMKIDEIGEYRIRNKNDSDHNAIIATINMRKLEK